MKLEICFSDHRYTITDCLGHDILINGERVQFSTYEEAKNFIFNAERENDYMGMGWFDIENRQTKNEDNTNENLCVKICCICNKEIKENAIIVCKECHNKIKEIIKTGQGLTPTISNNYDFSLVSIGMLYNEFVGFNKGDKND